MPKEKNFTVNPPVAPTGITSNWGLQHTFKGFKFKQDEEGYIEAIPVITFDPTRMVPGSVAPLDPLQPQFISYNKLATDSLIWIYKPSTNLMEAQRTPDTFKNVASASDFNIWDPAAGKKFRLMGFTIRGVAPSLGAAAVNSVALVDNATDIMTFWFFCNTAIATARDFSVTVDLPGNGYLSVAADNILNANIGTGLTAGYIEVNAWGTEE